MINLTRGGEGKAMKQYIEFNKTKYEFDKYTKDAIDGFTSDSCYRLVIDRDFHIYAIDNNQHSHWIGDASPYELEWFDSQFSK